MSTEQRAKTQSPRTGFFATLRGLLRARGSGAPSAPAHRTLAAILPTASLLALAAALSPPPAAAAGLPDGRVYEQVSPAYKNGNLVDFAEGFGFGLARADGDAVVYPLSGAAGTAYSGTVSQYVSRRTPGSGWSTVQTVPRQNSRIFNLNDEAPTTLVPSADFTKFLFAGRSPYVQGDLNNSLSIFLSEDPAREPQWLSRPQIANPIPALGENEVQGNYVVTGAAPDLSSVYFGYAGTLLPEDEGRLPNVRGGQGNGGIGEDAPWGFYEWSGGALREAGTLPDGTLNPFGAVPAAIGLEQLGRQSEFQAGSYDNWMSSDGRRALFVSPDPIASSVSDPGTCASQPPCASEPPQLYLREALAGGGHRVTLVSHSMLPGQEGDPAPDGPVSIANPTGNGTTYAFGTPDESHVFFASTDFLTVTAQEANVSGLKEYEYDTSTGGLTYLPEVHGEIAAVNGDGSELAFVNTAFTPGRLELWKGGADGGNVTSIGELPEPPIGIRPIILRSSQFSADGSVLVFTTNAPLPGFNNGGENTRGATPIELYRYDVPTEPASPGVLTCVSCPAAGVTPTGDAYTSYNNRSQFQDDVAHINGRDSDPQTTSETRAISADGRRVFFDTPNPLVSQDTNNARDVYESENSTVSLISSGAGTEPSFYVDSSESGDDVFFATAAGLSLGDTDEAYDVYDARIPRPGDTPPPPPNLCQGESCQGSPAVSSPPLTPASAAFSGAGNLHARHRHPKRHHRKHPKKAGSKHARRTQRSSATARAGNDRRIG